MIKVLAKLIFSFDQFVYHKFGIVTKFRRKLWNKRNKALQAELDNVHLCRDKRNSYYGTDYTTLQALSLNPLSHFLLFFWSF